MDLTGFLKRKLGPLPMGAWIFIAVVVAFALVKLHGKGKAGATSTDPTAGGQFSTSQTHTDANGNTVTYTASGPNSSIQSPAQLSYAASPMGYSGGDVYVNIPASPPPPVPTPTPAPLPPPPAPPPCNHDHDHDPDPHHGHGHDHDHDNGDWFSGLLDLFTPATQTTSVQVPQWEVPNYVGQHQGGYADAPGNSGDSLFNPDNVQRVFG